MCGIAGVVALRDGLAPPEIPTVAAMLGAMAHRGPDGFGVYRDQRAALGHARLSIVDLATGQQPMSNEDGTLWIVFNGEIFNYPELRAELAALGHRFRTRSDTEVIVHAYEAWGDQAFERFNGQFAVALWDAQASALVLARDGFGVHPLYVREHAGRLWFASEVKALFAGDAQMPRRIDAAALAQTFTFWTVVAPRSAFEGVSELEPGRVRRFSPRGVGERSFWAPRYPPRGRAGFDGSLEEASERLRASLEEAVRLRMLRADVPVGSYLSGGLDSSVVAALARRAKGGGFATYSLRFEDAEYDETAYQRRMARLIESEHHELLVTRRDIAEVFPDVVAHAERPLLRTAPAPLYLLSRRVREGGTKVVLTGEGADELFAGYDLFREGKVRRWWARSPRSPWRPRLLERLYPYLARSPVRQRALAREFFGRDLDRWADPGFAHRTRWRSAVALQRLFHQEARATLRACEVEERLLADVGPAFSGWSALAQDQYLESRTLLSGYLLSAQGDRMLMAHSVEGRFPYLDPEVVALANALPDKYKLRVLDEKHVLKRAARGLVSDDVLRRPKQPYRAPDAASFLGPRPPQWIEEMLSAPAIRAAGWFDPAAVAGLWAKCRAQGERGEFSNADNMALVGVLSTQLLHWRLVRAAPAVATAMRFAVCVDRLQQTR